MHWDPSKLWSPALSILPPPSALLIRCLCALCCIYFPPQLRRENDALRKRIADAERRLQKSKQASAGGRTIAEPLALSDPVATLAAAAAVGGKGLDFEDASASVDPSLLSVADRALAGQ